MRDDHIDTFTLTTFLKKNGCLDGREVRNLDTSDVRLIVHRFDVMEQGVITLRDFKKVYEFKKL